MNFEDFLGNEEVKEALSAAFSSGRFPHAIILEGEKGCGKNTLARLIAKGLVCRDRDNAPCGVCPACLRAAAGSHPDIRIEEGSGKSRSLSVDSANNIVSDAYRKPEEAEYSVYILPDRIQTAAQNKLLKVVEEPPEGAVFIIVCEAARQLLPTIRSRAQCFTLRPPEKEAAARWLCAHTDADEKKARELADLCAGNLGRMQEELDGGTAGEAMKIAVEIARAMLAPGEHELLKAAAPLQKDRELFQAVLARLTAIFRDACVLRSGGKTTLGGAEKEADRLGDLPMKQLAQLPGVSEEYEQKLERFGNMSLLVTGLCARLRQLAGR